MNIDDDARSDISGLILAGGRGSRMGHVEKGLQPFRGATMLAHVLQRLAPQLGPLSINANAQLERYAVFGLPVWQDARSGYEGPLAGLETGLRHCATPLLLTVPCDAPFLPADLVARLLATMRAADADLVLAETLEGEPARVQPQPVFTLLKASLLPQLSAYLDGGGRRMDGWHGSLRVARARFDDATAFRNINTLLELQQFASG